MFFLCLWICVFVYLGQLVGCASFLRSLVLFGILVLVLVLVLFLFYFFDFPRERASRLCTVAKDESVDRGFRVLMIGS